MGGGVGYTGNRKVGADSSAFASAQSNREKEDPKDEKDPDLIRQSPQGRQF